MSSSGSRLAIFAPSYLLPAISASLDRVPEARRARANDHLILSHGGKPENADTTILIAPSLERLADWALRQNGFFPMERASWVLARLGDAIAGKNVTVIEECDLPTLPGRVLQTIGVRKEAKETVQEEAALPTADVQPASNEFPFDLGPLRDLAVFPTQACVATWWPSHVFHRLDGLCSGPTDITGRARILFFGPYIALPYGSWQADVIFEVCDEAARYDYIFEFGAAESFSHLVFRPPFAGRHKISLQCAARDYSATELRIGLLRAAFHGEFALIGAQLTKLASGPVL